MKRERPGPISPVTIGRRTWMEWFGQATVLSLGHYMLGCGSEGGMQVSGAPAGGSGGAPADAGPDQATADAAGLDSAVETGASCETQFAFAPGAGTEDVFTTWGERTVDEQSTLLDWKLTIDGLVETPREFTFRELICLPRQDQTTDFHCVEGWSVYDVPWNGVRLAHLLSLAKPLSTATHVAFRSTGGKYSESLPMAVALEEKTMLGYGVAGSSLPLAHGFPARVVVPRLLGYKNAKYVSRIELVNYEVPGFWTQWGYPYDGEVPPARLRPGKY